MVPTNEQIHQFGFCDHMPYVCPWTLRLRGEQLEFLNVKYPDHEQDGKSSIEWLIFYCFDQIDAMDQLDGEKNKHLCLVVCDTVNEHFIQK